MTHIAELKAGLPALQLELSDAQLSLLDGYLTLLA